MRIAVVDGQGGGIGSSIVEKLRGKFGKNVDIIALGTNALATNFMIKAGANEGASGENAIVVSSKNADIIVGVIGIIVADSMLGEITPQMALAIAVSPAKKILIPLNRCNVEVAGVKSEPLGKMVDYLIESVEKSM